jgi:sec-independent protein translocase protein TatC
MDVVPSAAPASRPCHEVAAAIQYPRMSSAPHTASSSPAPGVRGEQFDPDDYRMTVGEHLEELRRRLILGIIGFVVVLVFALVFGKQVTAEFCAPLINTLQAKHLNPQLFYDELSDGFMVFINISLISAVTIASPWILYQVWQFVAAGLYPHERKWVTRYLPLSLGLLVAGMLFVYFLVLPWTVEFFIDFGSSIPLPEQTTAIVKPSTQPTTANEIAQFAGDPDPWPDLVPWLNTMDGRLKIKIGKESRVIPFGPTNLAAPHITLDKYIDLVVGMLITFGLSFQLPLVVMVLARVGIVPVESLRKIRRYVYFALAVLAAAITPGDVITSTVALMVPLGLLYELGIWLAATGRGKVDVTRD